MEIHVDTDIGGDIDDLAAMIMLLKWPGVEIAGVTTVADDRGLRAGYAHYVLKLAHRDDIPVKAGADSSSGNFAYKPAFPQGEKYWPDPIFPIPNSLDGALELLKHNIEMGAAIVCIGQYTNLYLLDQKYPGIIRDARIFLMGGSMLPSRPGYPQLNNEDDYNIQLDPKSAQYVFENSSPVVIPLAVPLETALRKVHIEEMSHSDALGRLMARQAAAFAEDEHFDQIYGCKYEQVPKDLIDFLYDPVACAVAAGYNVGVEMNEIPLRFEINRGLLSEKIDAGGKPTKVITKLDGEAFSNFWWKRVSQETIL